jgi:hypothetical protein
LYVCPKPGPRYQLAFLEFEGLPGRWFILLWFWRFTREVVHLVMVLEVCQGDGSSCYGFGGLPGRWFILLWFWRFTREMVHLVMVLEVPDEWFLLWF